jgi:peptidoglycan/xylan/chitin deacetylase (PgdA/CDA1 family)
MKRIGQLYIGAKKWVKKQKPRAAILLYHRVAVLESDPQLLSVTPENFYKHLNCLKRFFVPLALEDLIQGLKEGRLPHNSIVITFDDGYKDNLDHAKPLLETFDMPATVFVTTGKLGSQSEFWWDELERILLVNNELPDTLRLNIEGRIYKWYLNGNNKKAKKRSNWNVLMAQSMTPFQKAYSDLSALMRGFDVKQREDVLDQLRFWCRLPKVGRPNYLALNNHQLRSLAKGGLVRIGSHGFSHSVFSHLDDETQKFEIIKSKMDLETIIGKPVTTFSYPFGADGDFNDETIRTLKSAGYQCACANLQQCVVLKTDLFRIPRFLVRNWGVEEFFERITRFFSG